MNRRQTKERRSKLMAKTGTKITKANIQKKKTNRFTKDECVKEIARLKEMKQDNSKYFDNVMEQAKKLGVA